MSTEYVYLSTFDANGVLAVQNWDPATEERIKETVSRQLKSECDNKYPNGTNITVIHPDWIRNIPTDLEMEVNEVKVTFVNEGAGYRNAFGYYVYETAKPPTTVAEISRIYFIFPNASLGNGGGGNMSTGDTVKLCYSCDTTLENGLLFADLNTVNYTFPAGTSIGWVIFANGWNGSKVNTGVAKYYSQTNLNPEKTESKRVHLISAQSTVDPSKIIYGFEDLNRDSGSDNDFNDLLYYVTYSPLSSLSRSSFNIDGVDNSKGTIICNDETDFTGIHNDLDYNDIVASYDFNTSLSGGKIAAIEAVFHLKHRGSWHDHSFGVIIPNISSLKGTAKRETFIGQSTTATVEDISSAVFSLENKEDEVEVCFSTRTLLPPNPKTVGFCNTVGSWLVEDNQVWPSSVRIVLTFTEPVDRNFFNTHIEPYIPYLRIWSSAKAGEGESLTRRYDTPIEAPGILTNGGINMIRPIYILPGEVAYRPAKEKSCLHHAYPRFFTYVKSNETDQEKWWDNVNFAEPKLLLSTYTDPVRIWSK